MNIEFVLLPATEARKIIGTFSVALCLKLWWNSILKIAWWLGLRYFISLSLYLIIDSASPRICVFGSASVCVCPAGCISVWLSIWWCVCLRVCLAAYLCACLPVCVSCQVVLYPCCRLCIERLTLILFRSSYITILCVSVCAYRDTLSKFPHSDKDSPAKTQNK